MSDLDVATEEPNGFFMVWTKSGWAPRKAHASFDAAAAEASRLARANPGKKFFVLKPVAKFHAVNKGSVEAPKPQVESA